MEAFWVAQGEESEIKGVSLFLPSSASLWIWARIEKNTQTKYYKIKEQKHNYLFYPVFFLFFIGIWVCAL